MSEPLLSELSRPGRVGHLISSTGASPDATSDLPAELLRSDLKLPELGELDVVRTMARELAVWFPQHSQSMDAALALHLRRVGYDPATDTVHAPDALPQELIHGCGGACSSGDDEEHAAPAPQPAVA